MFAFDTLLQRLRRGRQTMGYPQAAPPALPDRHGGALRVDGSRCVSGCTSCVLVCPTQAIIRSPGQPVALDLGRCLFCAACVEVCPAGAIRPTDDHRMAVRRREDLILGAPGQELPRLAGPLDDSRRRLFARSLRLRQVSAGGNGAEEADLNVLGTIGWDITRFGIQFVASPRHADGLVVTGPISHNMTLALRKTWSAIPEPRLAIAVGAEAISGGAFRGLPQVHDGAGDLIPIDLFIPGWPPHPLTILDGLLRLLGQEPPAPASTPVPLAPHAARGES